MSTHKHKVTRKTLKEGVLSRMVPSKTAYLKMAKQSFSLSEKAVELLQLKEMDQIFFEWDSNAKKFFIKKGEGFKTRLHPTFGKRIHRFFSAHLRWSFIGFWKLKNNKTYVFMLVQNPRSKEVELTLKNPSIFKLQRK